VEFDEIGGVVPSRQLEWILMCHEAIVDTIHSPVSPRLAIGLAVLSRVVETSLWEED
jgi:hypothetical protein